MQQQRADWGRLWIQQWLDRRVDVGLRRGDVDHERRRDDFDFHLDLRFDGILLRQRDDDRGERGEHELDLTRLDQLHDVGPNLLDVELQLQHVWEHDRLRLRHQREQHFLCRPGERQ